ncbi:transcription factor bHLH112-like [Rutidosis leptorrhynchoides]|uniref:transcription factor bHLH112-like n=1 Tax=Rutidosis leptorrhynchoides TaxID=125765 RepID=UPI003A993278
MAEEFEAEICGGNWWSSQFMSNYGSCWQQNDHFMNYMMKIKSTDDESSDGCAAAVSPDSAFQMIGLSPSTTTNCNQALLIDDEENYNQTLPKILNNLSADSQDSSSLGMEQQETLNLVTTSHDHPSSSLLQTLFESKSPQEAPLDQSLYDFQANLNLNDINNNPVTRMSSGFSYLEQSSEQVLGGLHLSNKTPFWNTSMLDLNDNRAGNFASTQPQYLSSTYGVKSNSSPNFKPLNEEIQDMGSSIKKSSCEPPFKRPRLETPSPLPTFKVRKEKLGDRVTALQQLVSPFGKTDTASVLHEAIEYIKLLHDQVNVLSTPYMKNGTTMQHHVHNKVKDVTDGTKQELRTRGLCLVPVSSTFPVATETGPDYWTSSFGSTFK